MKINPRDVRYTPFRAFQPILRYLPPWPTKIWEPACGDRRLIRWMRQAKLNANGADLSEGESFNFLKDRKKRECIVTNPPFTLAYEFMVHAMEVAEEVFFLLPNNYLASQERGPFYEQNPVHALFPLIERPSFTNDGKTDRCDYAWYYWGDRLRSQITHLRYSL